LTITATNRGIEIRTCLRAIIADPERIAAFSRGEKAEFTATAVFILVANKVLLTGWGQQHEEESKRYESKEKGNDTSHDLPP
jgi:hypothetical protein